MALICPSCSRRAEITARYCRDCYTVFPQPKKKPPKRKERRAYSPVLHFAPVLLVLVGGYFIVRPSNNWSDSPPAEAAAGTSGGWSFWGSGGGGSQDSAAEGSAAELAASAAPVELGEEELSATSKACPSGGECPVVLRFGAGETGSFVLEQDRHGSPRLVPADRRSARLLERNRHAVMKPREGWSPETVAIEKRNGRWTGRSAATAAKEG